MSIAQRAFLHPPAWNTETIERYVSQHIIESEHLDFKSPPGWNDGMDAAKDVAAFANHLGGDIIIGINDDGNDHAKDWNPIPNNDIAVIEEKAWNWLKAHLYPREFVQTVRMQRVSANIANHSVLVISVPPYPDLVGIEKTGNRKGEIDFRFPIRVGTSTRWLIFEEIMKRFASSTRSVYIRLKMFEANPDKDFPIRFSSPVLMTSPIGTGATIGTKPAPGEDGIHCRFDALSEDTITVKMRALPSVSNAMDYRLAIPLEFIRAVWEEPKRPSGTPRLFIALDAEIVWNGLNAWHLLTNTAR